MGKSPSHRQAPRRDWRIAAVVIGQVVTLGSLLIFVPSLLADVEALGRLLAFLVELARLV